MRNARARFSLRCGCCGDGNSAPAGTGISRRSFLASSAAATAGVLGASALGSIAQVRAQTGPAPAERRIIDVHHHISPPKYLAETKAEQVPPTINWSAQKSIEDMDRGGVATSITSITTPGVWVGDGDQAVRLARECNDYAARLVQDHPGRFGMFASLPLPEIDKSLREIEYALDTLKADGIGLLTSFGDKWLGDPAFDPVMDELNRRKAVVYTHPSTANCCRNLIPSVQPAIVEFGTDTTRAIASLLYRGRAKKYPDIKFIFSHAGGTMPFLVERFIRLPPKEELPGGSMEAALKSFHYDIAQSSHPIPLGALVKLVSPAQIVFGTDFPFRTSAEHAKSLVDFGFKPEELRAIDRENVAKLLPKYRV